MCHNWSTHFKRQRSGVTVKFTSVGVGRSRASGLRVPRVRLRVSRTLVRRSILHRIKFESIPHTKSEACIDA